MFTDKDRETSYYSKKPLSSPSPEPLLVDLTQCVKECGRCVEHIDPYPRHTHMNLHGTEYNPRYECVCHKCVPVPRRFS